MIKSNNRYLIKTQSGYKDFDGIRRTENTGLIIKTRNAEIRSTEDHRILVGKCNSGKIYRKAKNLNTGNKINKDIVLNIEIDKNKKYYYDPINVKDGNNYLSHSITHHNCLVIDECISEKETITVRDKETGEIKILTVKELYSELKSTNCINNKYQVLTSDGFQEFEGIKRSKHKSSVKIVFGDFTDIIVTECHKFFNKDNYIVANELKIGDILSGKKILDIIYKEHKEKYFYDLLEVSDGHHYTTSGVESSNCAFIRPSVWEAFSDSIFPAQSGLSWKKNISISTANGMNFFYNLVKGARDGTNGTKIFEVDWEDVPRYDTDGSIMEPEKFKDKIVKKHGIVYFEQNYGNNFVGSSHTLVDASALEKFISVEPQEIRDGKLKIYKYPEKGHQYICSVDSAKDGIDDFSVQIIDITDFKFEQVASAQLQIDYLLMPEYINDWCEYYNKPYLIIENNEGAGQSIADQMHLTYEYENLHFDKDSGTKKKKKYPGFRTTTKSRKLILQTLKLFIENNNLIIHDKKTINQFYTFILLNNKYQADENCKDDAIMSLAITFAPFCNSKNFEDMKGLVDRLYSDIEYTESEDKGFIEFLTIGSFDDTPNLDEFENTRNYAGYTIEPDGFY